MKVVKTLCLVGALALAAPLAGAQERKDRARDEKVEGTRRTDKTDGSRYSDRDRKSDWERGKQQLEQALKTGENKDFYRKELEKLGFQVTSVNYDKPEYVEWEIVKGDQTYEIQVDMDKSTNRANKVNVSSNMWKADATEQALKTARGGKQRADGKARTSKSERSRDREPASK